MISLLDLKVLNATMQNDIEEALLRVARSGRYILGEEVEAFESAWAAYCGTKYCVGMGNALEALWMTLHAYGIGKGDEVIVPTNTYIATWISASLTEADVVPVEPDPATFNLDPLKVEAAITERTAAIVPVHLYGRPADMTEIMAIARRRSILVVEDAAQAHGAREGDEMRRVGALGHAAAFSFYPSKNLGALGDAGAVTTNDRHLYEALKRLRHYGGVGRIDHQIKGVNSRLDEMQAAVLRAKLKHLDALNDARRARADFYRAIFSLRVSFDLPADHPGHVYHQFVVRHQNRNAFQAALLKRGIDAHVHYPVPPYLEGAYEVERGRHLWRQGRWPICETLAHEVLSLPIGYGFDIEKVCNAVLEVEREGAWPGA